MTTVRQIERFWNTQQYPRLFKELIATRPERTLRLELELDRRVPTAALALIRLEELNQSHVPLYSQLLRVILGAQEADGGWGEPMTTALCLRALFNGRGEGLAIEQGLTYLANLQKSEGIWPNVPLRRMPADAYVSAFILCQLGDHVRFRAAVRFVDALSWFEHHGSQLDGDARKLWDRAQLRCRPHLDHDAPHQQVIWS